MRLLFALLPLVLPATLATAQQASPWQGEWGAFSGAHAEQGRRLSIDRCSGNTCHFSIQARTANNNSGTASDHTFTLSSDTTAEAILPGENAQSTCTLHFQRQSGTPAQIQVQATGASCTSYYSTSASVTMGGTYPLRSTTTFSGEHAEECFTSTAGPALLATCTHPDLAALEQKWELLAEEYPLHSTAADESNYQGLLKADASLLHSCDADPHPSECAANRFNGEIATMQARKDAYLQGTIERGDPALGGELARKIAGRYRNRSENGDVSGRSYMTTDTLTIQPVGSASIHFDAELNFFNGHTCSLSGGALFRKDGSFVFDDAQTNALGPDSPACRLAIIPTATGVDFKDINGGCKSYCGERGGWNNSGFTFAQRVKSPAKPTAR